MGNAHEMKPTVYIGTSVVSYPGSSVYAGRWVMSMRPLGCCRYVPHEKRILSANVTTDMELIRIRGHLTLWGGGIHHAEIKTAVRAGVPAPDG